jgi:hypothetical protein
MSFRIFRKDLESCKIRLVCGQLTLGDPILCSGVTLECDLSAGDLLDEHLGLNDDVTLLFFSRHPVTVMDRGALLLSTCHLMQLVGEQG